VLSVLFVLYAGAQVDPLHAHRTFAFALATLEAAADVVMPDTGLPVRLHVGIHSG
jgi:class 3 adenylate cyclase